MRYTELLAQPELRRGSSGKENKLIAPLSRLKRAEYFVCLYGRKYQKRK